MFFIFDGETNVSMEAARFHAHGTLYRCLRKLHQAGAPASTQASRGNMLNWSHEGSFSTIQWTNPCSTSKKNDSPRSARDASGARPQSVSVPTGSESLRTLRALCRLDAEDDGSGKVGLTDARGRTGSTKRTSWITMGLLHEPMASLSNPCGSLVGRQPGRLLRPSNGALVRGTPSTNRTTVPPNLSSKFLGLESHILKEELLVELQESVCAIDARPRDKGHGSQGHKHGQTDP